MHGDAVSYSDGATDIVTFILSVYDVIVCVLACVSAVLVFLFLR